MSKEVLKAGINRTLDDTRLSELTRNTLRGYGRADWNMINEALKEWEKIGYLQVLKNPEEAQEDEVCVKMYSYIDRQSPWPDWPVKK